MECKFYNDLNGACGLCDTMSDFFDEEASIWPTNHFEGNCLDPFDSSCEAFEDKYD